MSLIDDKKSSQVTYSTDQIMNNREKQRAFFEQAEQQIAPPPTFERFDLNEEPQPFDTAMLTSDNEGLAEAPEFAQPLRSHEDLMKETISHLTHLQCVQATGAISLEIVSLRHLN